MVNFSILDYEKALKEKNLLVKTCGFDQCRENAEISFLTYDSREVTDGTLFICKGAGFREDFLRDSVRSGAVAYVSEKEYDVPVPALIVSDIRKAMPVLAEKYTCNAWKDLKITAFGGTKGKSTSTYFMKSIVDEYMKKTGGKKSALLSSISNYDGGKMEESHLTTPEAVELHRHILAAKNNGITWMEMEVSSQALKYHRVDNMRFDVGVFLNISEDHISSVEHKDFEDYFNSKMKMFTMTDHAVVNLDCDKAEDAIKAASASHDITTFSIKNPEADYYGYDIKREGRGYIFKVKGKNINGEFEIGMPGLFNVENAMAAVSAAGIYGIPEKCVKAGLLKARADGRMEMFASKDRKVIAIVDYAHNALSFRTLFKTIEKENQENRKVISVFGCPGDKAQNRRRDLGTIAGAHSDMIYLVPDDPGFESPADISEEIARYVRAQNCPLEIVDDRGEGIRKAIFTPDREGDSVIVLMLAKGRETTMKVGSNYITCKSDVDYAGQFISEYDEKHS